MQNGEENDVPFQKNIHSGICATIWGQISLRGLWWILAPAYGVVIPLSQNKFGCENIKLAKVNK